MELTKARNVKLSGRLDCGCAREIVDVDGHYCRQSLGLDGLCSFHSNSGTSSKSDCRLCDTSRWSVSVYYWKRQNRDPLIVTFDSREAARRYADKVIGLPHVASAYAREIESSSR